MSIPTTPSAATPPRRGWSPEEHARYLEALALFPNAPWRVLAEYVGTRTTRQVMTHASKIALKQQRHARGLKAAGRRPRVFSDDAIATTEKTEVRRQRQVQRRTQRSTARAIVAAAATEPLVLPEPLLVMTSSYVQMLSDAQDPRRWCEARAMELPTYGVLMAQGSPVTVATFTDDLSEFGGGGCDNLIGDISWDEMDSLVAL